MIANAHVKNFHADYRTEIRALADVNTQALQAMGSEYGIPHLTTDYRDILKDPGLTPSSSALLQAYTLASALTSCAPKNTS